MFEHSRQADQFTKTTKEVAAYVERTYTFGGDIRFAVDNLELPVIAEPADPPDNANATQKLIWEKRVDVFVQRETYLEENVKALYFLVWGQCTDIMRQKIQEAMDTYSEMHREKDGVALLKAIKSMVDNTPEREVHWTLDTRIGPSVLHVHTGQILDDSGVLGAFPERCQGG